LIEDSFIAPADDQPRNQVREDFSHAPAYQTASDTLYDFFAPAVQTLDAGARRWFRKLLARRISTLRKPGAMPYRSGARAPLS
jgi:hypothetical protein